MFAAVTEYLKLDYLLGTKIYFTVLEAFKAKLELCQRERMFLPWYPIRKIASDGNTE